MGKRSGKSRRIGGDRACGARCVGRDRGLFERGEIREE